MYKDKYSKNHYLSTFAAQSSKITARGRAGKEPYGGKGGNVFHGMAGKPMGNGLRI
ncbi:hypothetical protein AALC25_02260 [Lachnospiraceae bacterium 29-84]